ncbi:MAG: TonB-dependent receptor [bacterium]
MHRVIYTLAVCFIVSFSFAQEKQSAAVQLDSVVVKGFESNSKLINAPASIAVVNTADLRKVSSYSLLPAFNAIAGVRMEERSPGSYRLSVRGSLLRSPFGVRNIKVYVDDYMFTDAGGNTYLNLLDITSVERAELIKGPGGSLYGAGTGGSLMLTSSTADQFRTKDTSSLKLNMAGGRYGTFNESIQYKLNKKQIYFQLNQGHNQSDGYREQSAIQKNNLQLGLKIMRSEKSSTNFFLLLSDLRYQTPGGLNISQVLANPRQARPATAVLPSAVEQKAGIFNRTGLLGISHHNKLSKEWSTVASLSSSLVDYKNPFITNYEKRAEYNLGLRAKIVYESARVPGLLWVNGIEAQQGFYNIDSSGNIKGSPDQNSVRDQIVSKQQFVFSQLNIKLSDILTLQSGVSINDFAFSIKRTYGSPVTGKVPVNFKPQILPRMAVQLQPVNGMSVYAQISKGYSSPTLAEVRPSAGGLYAGLQAEYGWNREVGVKLSALKGRIFTTLVYFDFVLNDAIVRQTNSSGAEYFMNAGKIRQRGLEHEFSYLMINKPRSNTFQYLKFATALTLNKFRFSEYQINLENFGGNKLTGVPDVIFNASVEVSFLNGFFSNVNLTHVGKVPLNDANSMFAKSYGLWQLKCGWRGNIYRKATELFALVDNLTNINYSLGNDLNAFGGRFYNPSATRNLLLGCRIALW